MAGATAILPRPRTHTKHEPRRGRSYPGAMPAVPPVAPRRAHVRSHHGDDFVDYYEWMRDTQAAEFIAYLEAENEYASRCTEHLATLRESIYEDILCRTKQTDLSVPELGVHSDGDYWYYARTVEGLDYPRYCRVRASDRTHLPDPDEAIDGEEVLLDANVEAAGAEFFELGALEVSPNGRLLAYSVDTSGDERYDLRFRTIASGTNLPDVIEGVGPGGCWAGDQWFCYARVDDAWRAHELWRHQLGADQAEDTLVLAEPDERFRLDAEESRDRRLVVITAASRQTTECHLLDVAEPTGAPRCITGRREGIEYDVEVADDRLFIVHNDDAPDFALAQAPLNATSATDWATVIPGQPGVRMLGVSAYEHHLVISLRRDGLAAVHVCPRDAVGDVLPGADLTFAEPLYAVSADSSDDPSAQRIRLRYQSMVTPPSVFDLDLATGQRTLLKRTEVLEHPQRGPYDPDAFIQRREWAIAGDGTRIPISVVFRSDVSTDATAPCLLYGYGAYEISLSPTFSISRLALLDRGFVYAIAHVRGGGELGRTWYEQGRLAAKANTFGDFVACADHLIASGYTSADRLAGQGGSAGGLLIGAVANLAPDRFRALHAAVPFVDALTTILKPELPLTVAEWEEWGDPLHDPAAYAWMKAYSPYENVQGHDYPAILATTSLNDTRVEVTEPAKWVAQLRHTAGEREHRPVLLKTEMVAGHGGVSGRYAAWRDLAYEYAWIVDHVTPGIRPRS